MRIHDNRHSYASRALALGESLPIIGRLLGHTKIQTTARYAHLARDSIKLSAARVAASIGADIRPARSFPNPEIAPALPGGTLIANLLRQTPKPRSPPCL